MSSASNKDAPPSSYYDWPLVTEITGPGSVYFQTKNIEDFVDYLGIEERSDSDDDT